MALMMSDKAIIQIMKFTSESILLRSANFEAESSVIAHLLTMFFQTNVISFHMR